MIDVNLSTPLVHSCWQVCAILEAHPRHQVLIGVDSLGKEDLLVSIATRLQTKVGHTLLSRITGERGGGCKGFRVEDLEGSIVCDAN